MEEPAFTGDGERFGGGFEHFPRMANAVCFGGFDFSVVFDGAGDGAEELAELHHQSLGVDQQFGVDAGDFGGRVVDQESAVFVAEPVDHFAVAGESDDVGKAVERVAGAARVGVVGVEFLAPLVDEGGRNAQYRGEGLDPDAIRGAFEDFVRFHPGAILKAAGAGFKALGDPERVAVYYRFDPAATTGG